MDEIVNYSALDHMLRVFVFALILVIGWLFEAIWRQDKRWVIPIILLPPLLAIPVVIYWKFTKARCFFLAGLVVIVFLAGGVSKYNFAHQLGILLLDLSIWPYRLVQLLL